MFSSVFSQQLMKALITHVLRRILHFRWLGETLLRIHLSYGVYAKFKVNFSHCVFSQFSYAFSFPFLLYCMVCRVYSLLSSFCPCYFNLTVSKTIKSYLILSYYIFDKNILLFFCKFQGNASSLQRRLKPDK